MMLHSTYQGSRPSDFKHEDFLHFQYVVNVNFVTTDPKFKPTW